jgi:hypothetical protein
MMNSGTLKPWVSALTGFTFAVVAFTGVLMLLDVRLPFMKGLHEWIGLAFAIAGLFHVTLNWRMFCVYLKRREALVSLCAVVLLCLVLLFVGGRGPEEGMHGGGHGRPQFTEVD